MRLRLSDFRENLPASALGICANDTVSCAKMVNKVQRRLVYSKEAGDQGWYGSYASMIFNVSRSAPYITAPREVAMFISLAVCGKPIRLQNEFFEFLDFGNGIQPPSCPSSCNYLESYTRNNVPTFVDLVPPNKKVRFYITNPNDEGKRAFISGLDNNGNPITELDNGVLNRGVFLNLSSPFVDTPMEISQITGIQKDQTFGQVKLYEVDMTTGAQNLLVTLDAGERDASYRRYFINGLPKNCCNPPSGSPDTVQVAAMAKLDLIDVVADTDFLNIQCLESLYEEAQSVRYSEIDGTENKSMAREKHQNAIRLLQGELVFRLGKNRPAIGFMNSERMGLQAVNLGMT